MKTLFLAFSLSAAMACAGNPRTVDNIFLMRPKQPPKVAVPDQTHQPQQFKSNDNLQHRAG